MNTRTRGAVGTLLDMDKLNAATAHSYLVRTLDEVTLVKPAYFEQAVITVDGGKVAVINSDGVGCVVTEADTIGIYAFAGMGLHEIHVDREDVLAARTSTEIDLADLIRTGPIRLDVNHAEWYARADKLAN